ncbi:MAG TPA: peptidase S9, partial [Verrucomicrobia bacterium]|nr:peptidase S9 [Verrucomicrobiota bacterium]
MKYIIFVLLLIQSLSGAQTRPEPDQIVLYKTTEQTPLNLHVFLPDSVPTGDPRPTILFFFGGGWNSGSPTHFYRQAKHLADRGMIACAAEYRVKSRDGVQPDSCVMDAKSAMRYLREHASKWNIDPHRIAASGGSAGGHLAATT